MVIFRYIWDVKINVIYPQQCCLCKNYLNDGGSFCLSCAGKFSLISEPKCECCGFPFEFKLKSKKSKLICPNCLKKSYKFDKAVAAVRYDEFSKKIILPLKHGDRTQYAKSMASMMFMVGREIASQSDYIIPVPIHLTRMLKRKYNQASLISTYLSKSVIQSRFFTQLF